MRVGLYTIPSTGTRFVSGFLRYIGADYSRRHVGDPPPCPEWRRVLTVRSPYQTYLSHKHEHPKSDIDFVTLYANYIWRTQWMDAFYFALDVPEENRIGMLGELSKFCEIDPDWEKIKLFEWNFDKFKSTRDRSEKVPEHMFEHLAFAREWYAHYTVFWGKRIRHTNTMLGEGP